MKTASYQIEIHRSKSNGEFYARPKHKNGKIILKETYKNRKSVITVLRNLAKAIVNNDYIIVDKTK